MLSDYFAAIASHPYFSQYRSTPQNVRQNQSWTLALRSLVSGLFFLMVLFFAIPAFPADLSIAWDPNRESNLSGYGVYFKKDSPGPPYDLFGNVTLQELSDPENPTFTFTDLENGSRYYFALTAFDTSGNESDYSDSVCAQIGDQVLPCTSADDSGGSGSDSGGSGSGGLSGNSSGGGGRGTCFIETASKQQNKPYPLVGALFFLGVIASIPYRKLMSSQKSQ